MSKYKDLTDMSFGELKVINKLENVRKNNGLVWKCKCSCGKYTDVNSSDLVRGRVTHCGCLGRFQDLTGKKYNSWTVLEYANKSKWKCQCQCGTVKIISGQSLKEGTSKSCGCTSYFNLIGRKIGRLTVIKYMYHKDNHAYVLCTCECGSEKVIKASDLNKKNSTHSCGCISKERTEYVKNNGMADIKGKKFGKWTVIEYSGKGRWLCRCECGNEKKVQTGSLTCGDSTSCGKCFENQVDSDFFNVIDTSEKAYILGFLYADGYNNEQKQLVRLDLQQNDEDVLIKIKELIKFEGEIKHYQNKDKVFLISGSDKVYKCKPTARLLIHNTNLSKQLALKGCTNNKTYNIKFPSKDILLEIFYRDFIRGLIDGDGSISYWIDNKKTGHKKFNISLTGTTELVNSVNDIIVSKFKCKPDIRGRYKDRSNNNVTLAICGNRVCEQILDWLYCGANIYLNRKFNKYIELKEINKNVTYNVMNIYCMTPIVQLNLDGSLVDRFKSMAEVKKLGFEPSGVCQACKKENHKYKNFLWYYEEEYLTAI